MLTGMFQQGQIEIRVRQNYKTIKAKNEGAFQYRRDMHIRYYTSII
jgi:hypothetical protein